MPVASVVIALVLSLGACTGDRGTPPPSTPAAAADREGARAGASTTGTRDDTAPAAPAPDQVVASAPAPAGDSAREQTARRTLDFFDRLIAIARAHRDDCEAMAAALARLIDDSGEVIANARQMEADPGSSKWFEEKYGAEFEARIQGGLLPALETCGDHPKVSAALERLEQHER